MWEQALIGIILLACLAYLVFAMRRASSRGCMCASSQASSCHKSRGQSPSCSGCGTGGHSSCASGQACPSGLQQRSKKEKHHV